MTAVLFAGEYRLVYKDANDVEIASLVSKNSREFSHVTGTFNTDPQKMPKLKKGEGKGAIILSQDDKLVLRVKLDTAVTENATSSVQKDVRVPVTIRSVKTGTIFEKTLVYADFTVTTAFVNSKVWATGTWYDLLTYTVPAQTQLQIAHRVQDVRTDSAFSVGFDLTT